MCVLRLVQVTSDPGTQRQIQSREITGWCSKKNWTPLQTLFEVKSLFLHAVSPRGYVYIFCLSYTRGRGNSCPGSQRLLLVLTWDYTATTFFCREKNKKQHLRNRSLPKRLQPSRHFTGFQTPRLMERFDILNTVSFLCRDLRTWKRLIPVPCLCNKYNDGNRHMSAHKTTKCCFNTFFLWLL